MHDARMHPLLSVHKYDMAASRIILVERKYVLQNDMLHAKIIIHIGWLSVCIRKNIMHKNRFLCQAHIS